MSDLIDFRDVSFEYGHNSEEETPVLVLNGINFRVKEGDFVAVLGHNGSGKSTLAKHVNAILQPTDGVVFIDGIDTCDDERVFDIRSEVGMVFQNPDNQLVATVVEEDVAFGLENLGVDPPEIQKRVDSALKDVEMYEFRKNAPHQLSGGQKQRVAIAGIIAMKPKCIVLDEPTAMLDPRGRREVLNTVKMLNREYGTTVLYITHFMDEAVEANRVVVVDNGVILLDGSPQQVFSKVSELKEVGLDVPQVTELCYELRKAGVLIRENVLTVEECVLELEQLLEDSHCQSSGQNI